MTDPQPSNPARRPDAMCGAKCRDGHPCTQYAVKGTNRCRMHGGRAPQTVAKAKRNILEARINGELRRREITPVTDPVTAIQDVVGREFAFLDLAQARMAEISESWVRENRITGSDDAKATVAIYTAALDRAERGATRMVQLGIQARIAAAQEMRAAAFIAAFQQAIVLARTTDRDPADIITQVITEEDQ